MPHNLTDVDAFTSPVAVPSGGDERNAASVETPFQALANRTRYLKEILVPTTPPSKTIRVGADAFFGPAVGTKTGAGIAGDFGTLLVVNNQRAYADLGRLVPSGATITGLTIRVKPGAARSGGSQVIAGWEVVSGDSTVDSAAGGDLDDGTTNTQNLTPSVSLTINRSTKRYFATLKAGNTAGSANDEILWMDVTFTDPGPRNY